MQGFMFEIKQFFILQIVNEIRRKFWKEVLSIYKVLILILALTSICMIDIMQIIC